MEDENIREYFPYKQIKIYLADIELREKIIEKDSKNIEQNLNMITISRYHIEQLLKASETSE